MTKSWTTPIWDAAAEQLAEHEARQAEAEHAWEAVWKDVDGATAKVEELAQTAIDQLLSSRPAKLRTVQVPNFQVIRQQMPNRQRPKNGGKLETCVKVQCKQGTFEFTIRAGPTVDFGDKSITGIADLRPPTAALQEWLGAQVLAMLAADNS